MEKEKIIQIAMSTNGRGLIALTSKGRIFEGIANAFGTVDWREAPLPKELE